MSFGAVAAQSGNIEIHGDQGSIITPDPNTFAGEVKLHRLAGLGWETVPLFTGYRDAARGYGVADLATTPDGTEPRVSGTLIYHVLDMMESMLTSADTGIAVPVDNRRGCPARYRFNHCPAHRRKLSVPTGSA